jgi:hyperosmotically inducible protein
MLRALLRIVLLIVVLAAVAAFVTGYWMADRDGVKQIQDAVGTSGARVNVENAREAGAEIAAKAAEGANQAQRIAANAALTAKIKSKMALDDTIKAAAIDVDTTDGVVTLTGHVGSAAERERALQLARETDGVSSVVDRLSIQ